MYSALCIIIALLPACRSGPVYANEYGDAWKQRVHADPNAPSIPTVEGSPATCPATRPCRNTGATCITSCKGLPYGDYQSCDACNVYHSCGSGRMFKNRPCGWVSGKWDDRFKRCEWKSKTCKDCPPNQPENAGFDLDFSEDLTPLDADSTFKWDPMPPMSVAENGGVACTRKGVLAITPASCVKSVTFQLTLGQQDLSSFHIGGTRVNDGYGGAIGLPMDRPDDAEIHLNYYSFDVFTSSESGSLSYSSELPDAAPGETLKVCIRIMKGAVYVSGALDDVTLEHPGLFASLDSIYVAFNRPISDAMFDVIGSGGGGGGTCGAIIDWSC